MPAFLVSFATVCTNTSGVAADVFGKVVLVHVLYIFIRTVFDAV